jgi:Glycosyltransferase Family 4
MRNVHISPPSFCVIHLELLIPTLVQSGAEKQLVLLATGLPREEFKPHVTCLTSGGSYETVLREAGIPVTVLGKRFQFDPLAFFRLRKHLRQRQPDILHTWLFAANSYGRLALPRGNSGSIADWSAGRTVWLETLRQSSTSTDHWGIQIPSCA